MAVARFDKLNAEDPSRDVASGEPLELQHARWLTGWVLKLQPDASEVLRLAARCQHLCRWQVPRTGFPADRVGYHRWKNHLKTFHAELSGRVLAECGYDEETIRKVQALNLKTNFPHDPESQTMEDALCLVFLELQLSGLAEKTEREKVVNALRKSWNKMSESARRQALALPFSPGDRSLVDEALAGS